MSNSAQLNQIYLAIIACKPKYEKKKPQYSPFLFA